MIHPSLSVSHCIWDSNVPPQVCKAFKTVSADMTVLVNNQTQNTTTQASLTQLLQQLSLLDLKGMAVAVNNNIVPKSNWDKHMLTEHDKITIIRATQGG